MYRLVIERRDMGVFEYWCEAATMNEAANMGWRLFPEAEKVTVYAY